MDKMVSDPSVVTWGEAGAEVMEEGRGVAGVEESRDG